VTCRTSKIVPFPPILTLVRSVPARRRNEYESYRALGAHPATCEGVDGTRFAVWARMRKWSASPAISMVGIVLAIPCAARWRHLGILHAGAHRRRALQYSVLSRAGFRQLKSDPYGFFRRGSTKTASIVWGLSNYKWPTRNGGKLRGNTSGCARPFRFTRCISNRGCAGRNNQWLTLPRVGVGARRIRQADGLHTPELMPVMEHPFSVRGVIR